MQRTLEVLDADADASLFIGDSTTDVTAASTAGVPFIGYANKNGKAAALRQAGAHHIVTTLDGVVAAMATG